MKKLISIVLAVVMIASCMLAFAGCKRNEAKPKDIVLITDGATITDGGYNQSAWNGVKSFADENNMSCSYYQPSLENDELAVEEIGKYIDLAVNQGAKYIVLPGEDFAVAAYEIAPTYKDVNFILVDATPHSAGDTALRLQQNVMCISFNVLQAGFLAGYCSVMDGYTKLGYFGSVDSKTSGNYGAGFVQGANAASAEANSKPVVLEYADFDSAILDYDYSFTITAEYEKIPTDSKKTYYTIKVENGTGSGTYADGENVTIIADKPEAGKKFSHWVTKSNTEGVKDSKVNISSSKKDTMNLLVEKCDATITAVYENCETAKITVPYTSSYEQKTDEYNVPVNQEAWITAPAAEKGAVFDHWECDNVELEDASSKTVKVNVGTENIVLNPVYVGSKTPTFDVTVVNGTGSGSYLAGDKIELVADAPKEGYMFKKWSNVDNQGLASGISMENEYNYKTSFEMVDRYASIVEAMYDGGTQVVFAGGNAISDSVFNATKNFDYQVYAFGAGIDEGKKGNCLASVVNDYGAAIKLAIKDFKGGSIMTASCENDCIYVTGKSINPDDESYNEEYAMVYNTLKNGNCSLISVQSGGDVRKAFDSKCLTLNYWIVEK